MKYVFNVLVFQYFSYSFQLENVIVLKKRSNFIIIKIAINFNSEKFLSVKNIDTDMP